MNSGLKADALRKALETVKRTAQAHMEAIKTAEAAFSAAMAQLAQDQRKLKQEREALRSQRADIDGEDGPPREEGPEQPEGEDEGQQMQQEDAEEEQPVEEEDDAEEGGQKTKALVAGMRAMGREVAQGSGKRGFDRSRSRSRGRKAVVLPPRPPPVLPPGGSPGDRVLEIIDRLGLDENASRAIKQFPPDQALDLLGQVGEGVRNTSAFVMTMCNRTLQEGHAPPPRGPTEFERLEAAIVDMRLDDSATRVLRELPPEQALTLLSQVDHGVRNPSAFVMSLAHRALKQQGGQQWQGPSLPDQVEQHIGRLRLDDSATRMVREIPPEQAIDIMEQCGDDVRNPSAFVTAEVRKIHHGGGGPRSFDQGPPRPPVSRDLSQQVAHLAKALDLDQDCLEALLSISTQEAVMILERLANTASNIRNRSAFVFAEVKKRKQAAAVQTPPPVIRNGARVPCKFWAEGRCRNGLECRFAHD